MMGFNQETWYSDDGHEGEGGRDFSLLDTDERMRRRVTLPCSVCGKRIRTWGGEGSGGEDITFGLHDDLYPEGKDAAWVVYNDLAPPGHHPGGVTFVCCDDCSRRYMYQLERRDTWQSNIAQMRAMERRRTVAVSTWHEAQQQVEVQHGG